MICYTTFLLRYFYDTKRSSIETHTHTEKTITARNTRVSLTHGGSKTTKGDRPHAAGPSGKQGTRGMKGGGGEERKERCSP